MFWQVCSEKQKQRQAEANSKRFWLQQVAYNNNFSYRVTTTVTMLHKQSTHSTSLAWPTQNSECVKAEQSQCADLWHWRSEAKHQAINLLTKETTQCATRQQENSKYYNLIRMKIQLNTVLCFCCREHKHTSTAFLCEI